MTTDPKELVARGYDEIAECYASWTVGAEQRAYWLAQLCERLPAKARVLDLGCGSGASAKYLCERGHDVIGFDISARQIELARQNAPGAEFFVGDIANCPCAPDTLDAAIALYSITHVPRGEHASLLRSVARCLKPGGLLLASMGAEATDEWIGPWLGTTMYFSHFDARTNEALVRDAGLRILRSETIAQAEEGKGVTFLWLLAERA